MSDLIDRQAAIDALADYIHNVDKVMGMGHLTADDCKDAAASVFEELPSVQTERKKGKWKKAYLPHEYMGCRPTAYYCSECNQITTFRTFYCPNCGADMRGEE